MRHFFLSINDKSPTVAIPARLLKAIPLGSTVAGVTDSGRNSTLVDVSVNTTPADLCRQSRAVCRSGSSQSLTKLPMVLTDCRELSSCELGSERLPTPDWAEDRASKTNRMQWLREKRTRRATDPRHGYSLYSRSDPERGLLKRAAG